MLGTRYRRPDTGYQFHNQIQILNSMGRGDKKTKKGKIFQGSFGKSRPHKPKKKAAKKS
jgi:30S ribosomal protein S31